MTSGKLSKRVAALGMIVSMVAMLVILLQLTSSNPAAAITTRIANENIQPVANATPCEPMINPGLSFNSKSPAEALSNGKPTFFFFQPYEQCQRRYCRQPQLMAEEIQARYEAEVNFVYVMAYERVVGEQMRDNAPLLFDNWDLYPVPPYSDWLPRPIRTEFGLGLEAPVVLLIDQNGHQVAQGTEYFDLVEFETDLTDLLSRRDS